MKEFLRGDFRYYTNLYRTIRETSETSESSNPHLFYCRLLNLDAPFMLIFSGCLKDDPAEDEKSRKLAYEIDRYFSLLQLQNVYDSNDFQDSLYLISENIRERPAAEYRDAFDVQIVKAIGNRRNVNVETPINYGLFRQTGINLNARFKRYVFARVDEFLAAEMNLNPKHSIRDLVTKTGAISGFHVEHILSSNDENLAFFDGDEESFEQARNRLGGILLLKGKDNISSGNETYEEKLRTYANTLYWNETLREDSYKSKLDMNGFRDRYDLDLRPMNSFGPEELEDRHGLLFELVKMIWA